jgi:hypothetical protein
MLCSKQTGPNYALYLASQLSFSTHNAQPSSCFAAATLLQVHQLDHHTTTIRVMHHVHVISTAATAARATQRHRPAAAAPAAGAQQVCSITTAAASQLLCQLKLHVAAAGILLS